LDKKAFVDILAKWEEGLKDDSYPVLVMENHDQPRALSRFGNRENYPYESATMLAALLYGMRGVPFVYQGQELGLHDPTFQSLEEYRDIETLNAYADLKATGKWTDEELLAKMQYGSRDCGRVPMPWNNEKLTVTLRNAHKMRKLSLALKNGKGDTAGTLEEMERKMMESALEKQRGNVTLAAAQLGITRQTLYNKGKKYNLFK
jgi:glycosidase